MSGCWVRDDLTDITKTRGIPRRISAPLSSREDSASCRHKPFARWLSIGAPSSGPRASGVKGSGHIG